MNTFRGFVDAFDTHGGHIICCIFLLCLGATFNKIGIDKGDDLIVFSLGVLARSMYGSSERESERAADRSAARSIERIEEVHAADEFSVKP